MGVMETRLPFPSQCRHSLGKLRDVPPICTKDRGGVTVVQWLRPVDVRNQTTSHIDFKTLAVFTREERVRLSIADDFTLGRVPVEFPA